MPDLNYSVAGYPFLNGDTLDPNKMWEMMYDPIDPDGSLSIINGLLDEDNLSVAIPAEKTQRGSAIKAWMRSGTANLDIFTKDWFNSYDHNDWDDVFKMQEWRPLSKVLPGAAWSGYIPWYGYVLVLWHVHWLTNGQSDSYRHQVFLEHNRMYVTGEMRQSSRAMRDSRHYGYARQRMWHGHAILPVFKGHHDIAIRVLTDATGVSDVPWTQATLSDGPTCARHWSRHLIVVPFKHPGGSLGGS